MSDVVRDTTGGHLSRRSILIAMIARDAGPPGSLITDVADMAVLISAFPWPVSGSSSMHTLWLQN